MTHTYQRTGMTCNGCVAKVKSELLKLGDITNAEVQLQSPQATIHMLRHVALNVLQEALGKAGNYRISELHANLPIAENEETSLTWLQTYKPLLIIVGYLLIIAMIAGSNDGSFDLMNAMRVFMSGFFLTFSFFKLLDLTAFAGSYSMYDVIAKRFNSWGYIYAFIELGLGIGYALNAMPVLINIITLIVMSISIIGVLQAVLNKRKIQCACLGTVFKLPMSTVTIVEDAVMIAMSIWMLVRLA